jgi:hypothetical protein
MDCCDGNVGVGVVGSGHAACTSSNAERCGHQSQGGVRSGHAPGQWRVHQNGRPSWRKQVRQGRDLLNMQVPHWLMIGGALLVFVGVVGTALQRRRAVANLLSLEQDKVTDAQPVSLPKFLE